MRIDIIAIRTIPNFTEKGVLIKWKELFLIGMILILIESEFH
jgi:S-methylmethionine-dependent homocysteine/selenocysteine methylase